MPNPGFELSTLSGVDDGKDTDVCSRRSKMKSVASASERPRKSRGIVYRICGPFSEKCADLDPLYFVS